jgi:hypothetical protein
VTVRSAFSAALGLGVALLAGCSASQENPRACPPGVIVTDAARLVRFKPGAGRDPTDVQFQAEIGQIGTQCKFSRSGVSIDTRVAIAVSEGPAAQNRQAQVTYFIAIIGPGRQIVARKEFVADYTFTGNRTRVGTIEELSQELPGVTDQLAPGYQIAVGFVLTQDEMNYNRQRTR